MKQDIEIAQEARIRPVAEIAQILGIPQEELELYGKFKAKIPLHFIDEERVKKAKLILVTGITPTPAGEGKTTTSIGLAQALNRVGKKTTVVLREPSAWSCIRNKRRCCRGRLFTGNSNGRYQPALYW